MRIDWCAFESDQKSQPGTDEGDEELEIFCMRDSVGVRDENLRAGAESSG
jgi:hypothetical protein